MRVRVNHTIAGLSFLAAIGMFSTANEPTIPIFRGTVIETALFALNFPNTIAFSLCSGFLVGVLIWLLNVYLPERQVRSVLRDGFAKRYEHFREDVNAVLLGAQFSYDSNLPAELSHPLAFRAYYREGNTQRWYDVLNYLAENPDKLSDIVAHMQLLSREADYVLHKVSFDDESVHDFFKRLSIHTFRLQRLSDYSYEEVKYLGGFIFEILALWSGALGYVDEDPIAQMIRKI